METSGRGYNHGFTNHKLEMIRFPIWYSHFQDGRTLVNSIYSGTRRCAGIGHCFPPNAKVVDIPERFPCKHEVASEHWANLLINDGLDMSETVIPHLPGEGC